MSELRQDIVSGDWIILAPGRANRPELLLKKKPPRKPSPKKGCPFEDLKKSGNWPPILAYPNERNWSTVVVKNKYPALTHLAGCAETFSRGPYSFKTGAGEHNLVITRDHEKSFVDMSLEDATRVFTVLQERYRMFAKDKCNVYASSFFNWGPTAGASVYHPHYQVLALPIIPPHVHHSLAGAALYYKEHHKCVRCEAIRYDIKEKKRIILDDRHTVALTPFISKSPFEVRIFPKRHTAVFEKVPLPEIRSMAATLQSVLRRMKKYLHDPDLNFFIHGAPLAHQDKYPYHHWHIEVIPKISNLGGFELSTGIEINVVDPDRAAAILRGEKL